MAWKTVNELLEDVYGTLQKVRGKEVDLGQAKVESRLLETASRIMRNGAPLEEEQESSPRLRKAS